MSSFAANRARVVADPDLATLEEIQRRVLWLAVRIVDHANHERPPGEIKVGGHQASSASMVGIMTALWFGHLGGGRQGRRQAPRLARVPRHQVPHRRARPLVPHPAARARRAAGVPEPDQGSRRVRLLDRLGRARRRRPAVRRRRPPLRRRPLRAGREAGATGALHRPGRRRRARRGQHLGGDRRPGAAGARQRDVGRRHQPPEPRPRRPGPEDQEADGVLRRRRVARRRGQVRRRAAATRSHGPAARRCAGTSTRCRTSSTSRCSPHRRRAARAVPRRRRRRRASRSSPPCPTTTWRRWCRTSAATTSACCSTPTGPATR